MKPEITYVGSLVDTRDYTDAQVHHYKSDDAEFYFDANFKDAKRIDGKDIYDVVVSYIGKKRSRQTDLIGVPNMEQVKEYISAFFKEHELNPAQNPARHVYFR